MDRYLFRSKINILNRYKILRFRRCIFIEYLNIWKLIELKEWQTIAKPLVRRGSEINFPCYQSKLCSRAIANSQILIIATYMEIATITYRV